MKISTGTILLLLICGMAGAQDLEANKTVVKQWVEAVWQKHDRSHISKNTTVDFPVEEYTAIFDSIVTYYPDVHIKIIKMVAEGENVALYWDFTGTSANPGTEGKKVENSGMSLVEIKDRKLNSVIGSYDDLVGYRQLGFSLRPPEEKKVSQVILDYHKGVENNEENLHSKIFDETYLVINGSTETWSSNYRDHMHTTALNNQNYKYECQVEIVSTTVDGGNATVDAIETGSYRNLETGDDSRWENYRNIWSLYKNTNGDWKIVGVVRLGNK